MEEVPFDSGRWELQAAEARIEDHLGRRSLRLQGGIATLAGVSLTDGVLDLDVAFGAERGFVGGIWRVRDARNYEEFYLRPHQSGNLDATQYSPVLNGLSGWQLYHGERYTVAVVHRFDEWTRLRIVFSGSQAEIYIGGLERPALLVDELKGEGGPGGVGVSALNFAPAHFSNVSFAALETNPFQWRPRAPEPAPEGAVLSWWISDAFPESRLKGKRALSRDDLAPRAWTRLATESTGLANLARVQGIGLRSNTAFARKVLVSDREQVKRLDLGFSDRVRLYLNGRLLFRGDDTARSRDYRFLGSIGYFDSLYLPLAPGENELLLAVSEDQGGWGVQARLEDLGGIVLAD